MIKVEYVVDNKTLERKYKAIFPYSDLQDKWRAYQKKHENVFGAGHKFPTVLQLLCMPIERLVDYFFEFTEKIYNAVNTGILDKNSKKKLKDDLSLIFNYDNKNGYRDKIARFFMEAENKFEIHTCHYCDKAYVNYFTDKTGKKIRQFDIEHILDKGRCPMVGLSLYNFLPSCQPCNRTIKKSKCIGETSTSIKTSKLKEIVKKLSPTNPKYDFDGNISFYIKPIDPLNKSFENLLEHQEDFEIELNVDGDADYLFEAEQFHLKERYNYHKSEAFRLKDLLDHYPKSKVEEIMRITGRSEDEVVDDLFGIEFHKRHHRTFGKLYTDIFRCYKRM
jgi:hypothetical protein